MFFPSTPSPQLDTYQQACCVHSKLHFICIEAKTNQFVNLPPVGKLIQVCLKCGYMEAGHEAMVLQKQIYKL
jgi:hypothetical protein